MMQSDAEFTSNLLDRSEQYRWGTYVSSKIHQTHIGFRYTIQKYAKYEKIELCFYCDR